jgi:hypothetical protein
MPPSGMLRCVALVRTDVHCASVTSYSCHADDEGDKFLRDVGSYKSHTVSHPRRRHSSGRSKLFTISQ